jgi:hypothetical protein
VTGTAPFDPGLQPERTLLAWRRTTLSLALVSAIGLRLTVQELGAPALVAGALGIAFASFGYLAASARYRRAHLRLTSDARLPNGGFAMASVALATVMLGLLGLAAIVVGVFR